VWCLVSNLVLPGRHHELVDHAIRVVATHTRTPLPFVASPTLEGGRESPFERTADQVSGRNASRCAATPIGRPCAERTVSACPWQRLANRLSSVVSSVSRESIGETPRARIFTKSSLAA
jgi:hypothetical protein